MILRDRVFAVWHANSWMPVLCLLLLLSNIGLYFWSSYHALPDLQRTETRYLQLQAEVRSARRLAASSGDPISQAERGERDLERFRGLIPARKDFDLLIGDLFLLADESGLQITRVTYRPESLEEQQILKYGLDFSVTGDYQQLKQFLYLLEGSERLITINKLSLGQGGGADNISLKLSLSTFFALESV